MKKLSVERIKTIILTLLIISSVLLTYRLWFNSHNLFSILEVFQSNKRTFKSQNGLEYVYSPSKIWVNLGESSHIVIKPTYQEYIPFQKEGVKLIKQSLMTQKFDVIEPSQWNTLLSSRSMLFGFETPINAKLLAKMFNQSNSYSGNEISIKDIIFIQDKTVSDNIKAYIKDEATGNIYATKFKYDDTGIDTLTTQIESKELETYVTGYELKHNLIKDDVLILPTNMTQMGKQIKLTNEVDINSTNQIKDFVQNFFENSNIVKNVEYKDDSKTRIIQKEFIDRKRILKLYENGSIDYTSAEMPTEGIQTDEFSALKRAVDFIDSNLSFPKDSYLSNIKVVSQSDYIFCFDYKIEGLKVQLSGANMPEHAIEIEVNKDVITSYKRCVKMSDTEKEKELDVINLKAIDQAILHYREQTGKKDIEKSIESIELIYTDNGNNGLFYPQWFIKIADKTFLIDSINKEN